MQQEIVKELEKLKNETEYILENKEFVSSKTQERYFRELERIRYEIFKTIEKINENATEDMKIDCINCEYKASLCKDILKIHIPEVLPKYKNISNSAYKNIMLNTARVVRPFKKLYQNKLTFVVIIVHENQENWDIDNKYVKPIVDALVNENVIYDDNINNMMYMAVGKNGSKRSYTEVFVMDGKYMTDWIETLQKIS